MSDPDSAAPAPVDDDVITLTVVARGATAAGDDAREIRRFRVVRRLSASPSAQLLLVDALESGRRSALAVMPVGSAATEPGLARFLDLAARARRLSHPNLLAVNDFGRTDDGFVFLDSEFVDGSPLSDVLAKRRTVFPGVAVDIARQIALGIQAAHEVGMVHGDLRPTEIILSGPLVGFPGVKVTPFGPRALLDVSGGSPPGARTDPYASPADRAGAPPDVRSDVYSLGAVLHHMLAGTPPGVDEAPAATGSGGARGALDKVVARALAANPAERFQTMSEFRDALLRATFDRRPVEVPPSSLVLPPAREPPAGARAAPLRGRRPLLIGAAAAAALLLASIPIVLRDRSAPVRVAAPPASAAARSAGPTARAQPERPAAPGATIAGAVPAETSATGEPPAALDTTSVDVLLAREVERVRSERRSGGAAAERLDRPRPATADTPAAAPPRAAPDEPRQPAQDPAPATPTVVAAAPTPPPPTTDSLPPADARTDSASAKSAAPSPAAPPPPAPAPSPPAAVAARPAIEGVVAAYARAIEARDMAVLRDAYPGMTDKERRSWEEFFDSVRDLTADLVVEDVVVTGPVAQATIKGVYRYRNTLRGRPERSPVEFRGVFSNDSSGWRLSAIR